MPPLLPYPLTVVLTEQSVKLRQQGFLEAKFMAEAQQEKRATRRFALRLPVAVTYAA